MSHCFANPLASLMNFEFGSSCVYSNTLEQYLRCTPSFQKYHNFCSSIVNLPFDRHIATLYETEKYDDALKLLEESNSFRLLLKDSCVRLNNYHELLSLAFRVHYTINECVKLDRSLSPFTFLSHVLGGIDFVKDPSFQESLRRVKYNESIIAFPLTLVCQVTSKNRTPQIIA
jgi:hypothetical protein